MLEDITKIQRKVTLDSNILIGYITSKKDGSIVRKAISKSITVDQLMLTDIIVDECKGYSVKPKALATEEQIMEKILSLNVDVILLKPIPDDEELTKKYKIRSRKDLKILYSADMTQSVIIVTNDEDFKDIGGLDIKIMNMVQYLYEEEFTGKKI